MNAGNIVVNSALGLYRAILDKMCELYNECDPDKEPTENDYLQMGKCVWDYLLDDQEIGKWENL